MAYYEVFAADTKYHGDKALTYEGPPGLPAGTVVSMPLRGRLITGFIARATAKPQFPTKPIKSLFSQTPLPVHLVKLAQWLSDYYASTPSQALRQLAPSKASAKTPEFEDSAIAEDLQVSLQSPLTDDQKAVLKFIKKSPNNTVLLHGETGSGKTRVYLELAKAAIKNGQSVIILTPEIALTAQLERVISREMGEKVYILHSQLTISQRKKIWKSILEAQSPVIVLGPRSALFSPVQKLGLIVVDEAHEPAYKQEQAPRYQTASVASQLGTLSGAKVILGTATPNLADYYLASAKR